MTSTSGHPNVRRRDAAFLFVVVAAAFLFAASPQLLGQPAPAPDGGALFKTYCAPCHGTDALGNGPIARALRHAPPDLTQMAKRNGGTFPAVRVRRIVEGRDVESHGDRDMPVWGDAFAPTRDGRSAATAQARLDAIVRYLEAIQRHDAQ
jgi:mono/diheme cytochrome c family protein